MSVQKKILKTPLRICIAIILLGMIAKFFEWSYAQEMMLLGFIAVGGLYPFRFAKKSPKLFLDYTKLILVSFWAINGVWLIFNFPYSIYLQIIVGITFILWFIMEGTAYFMDEDRRAKNNTNRVLWNCALVLGVFAVIAGSLLKVLSWAYAVHILSLGIIMIVIYILKDVFVSSGQKEDKHNNNEEYLL